MGVGLSPPGLQSGLTLEGLTLEASPSTRVSYNYCILTPKQLFVKFLFSQYRRCVDLQCIKMLFLRVLLPATQYKLPPHQDKLQALRKTRESASYLLTGLWEFA